MSNTGDNNNNENDEQIPPETVPNLLMQALIGEMTQLMRIELEAVHARVDRIQENAQQRQPRDMPIRRGENQPKG
ncbi:unnamed protein product [Arabis nemorensis]|uniref:Uncharacterized protein n=1 Tax=Arabis nemorensis TaxID=586526 RepID=A0A565BKW8_9BRAS|nr:unnamed protein product [Arabis nemorensis]